MIEQEDLVSDSERKIDLSVGKQDGCCAAHRTQNKPKLILGLGIQCRRGLIQQQDRWLSDQDRGKCDALRFAAGEGSGLSVGQMIDPEPLQKGHDSLPWVLWDGAKILEGEENFVEHSVSDAGDLNIGILQHQACKREENMVGQSVEHSLPNLNLTGRNRPGVMPAHGAGKTMEQCSFSGSCGANDGTA
jgi:hypothetical protein